MSSCCCSRGVLEWERRCHKTHHRLDLVVILWCSLQVRQLLQACKTDKDASQPFELCTIPKTSKAKKHQLSHTCMAPKDQAWGLHFRMEMHIYHSNAGKKYSYIQMQMCRLRLKTTLCSYLILVLHSLIAAGYTG